MSEIDRLYSYRALFTGRRVVPRQDILNQLEISLATFKRDLAKLRDRLNMPIEFDRDLGGYVLVVAQDKEELPGLWFSQDEILALLTIHNMLTQLEPGLLGPKLQPLQTRLNEMLMQQGLDTQTLTERIRLMHAGKRRLALKSFEAIAKATLNRRQVHIHHLNRQNGKIVERDISPQQLVHYRDNWYVDAWCHLRREVRSFSVDAIVQAQPLDAVAKELDADLLRTIMQSGYGIFGGQASEWARLKFSPDRARWVQHEQWHPEQRGALHADGSYTLELPYADDRELMGDILRHGSEVQVLSPKGLIENIREQLSLASKLYP
jgi:predicted DNA-binding transcriptional regulator YafY